MMKVRAKSLRFTRKRKGCNATLQDVLSDKELRGSMSLFHRLVMNRVRVLVSLKLLRYQKKIVPHASGILTVAAMKS